MRTLVKILSMLLVITAFLSVCLISVSADEFNDVSKDDEHLYEAVQLLNSLEIVKGQNKNTYGTSRPITREQMATFIFRLMKEGRSIEYGDNLTPFTDLEDKYYFGMISWASSTGIIKGVSETEFNPYGKITLQDCYVMITRALGYEKDGPLDYPHGYINVAERIGLHKNINERLDYADYLTRGDVAIIVYNAFFAEMYQPDDDEIVVGPIKPIKPEAQTVCEKIYNLNIIERRIAATPHYGIDLSAIPEAVGNSEYREYSPTYNEKDDTSYIRTAAIIPNAVNERLDAEEELIDFSKLKLSGNADDYFLKDITIYIKKNGDIVATNVQGKHAVNASMSIKTREGNDLKRDYYNSSDSNVSGYIKITKDGKIRTGLVMMGEDKAYLYNIPTSVSNSAWTIYPYDDGEGKWTFKAGIMWSGQPHNGFYHLGVEPSYQSFEQNPVNYMNYQRTNHDLITPLFPVARKEFSYYDLEYYDCNEDGIVDYFWFKPFTFGKIVDSKVPAYSTVAKHTGTSSNRAYYNASNTFPEIYVGDAKVEGGKYTNGQAVFAYVSGPANYVKIASDDINNSIKHTTTTPVSIYGEDGDQNNSKWENGLTIGAWGSPDIIVGHIGWTWGSKDPQGILEIDDDYYGKGNYKEDPDYTNTFTTRWKYAISIGKYWELYTKDSYVLWAKEVPQPINLTKNYAIIDYLNEEDGIVAWNAGYIDYDSTLVDDGLYVRAYIDGRYQFVPIAKKVGGVVQDNNYFVDNGLVNSITTYTVDKNGRYMFKPFSFTTNESGVSVLAGDDDTATYNLEINEAISLKKYKDNLYKFVGPAGVGGVPGTLKPNGMNYVSIDSDTLVMVKFINEDGEVDFRVYENGEMPHFDTDDAAMAFTKSYIVLRNNPDSTTVESLAFLYCEIGGEIVNVTEEIDTFAVIIGNEQIHEANKDPYIAYQTYDLMTGKDLGLREVYQNPMTLLDNFMVYEFTDNGKIKNTASGEVASLKVGSSDLVTIDSFYADGNLIFLSDGTNVLVDNNTTYVLVDRENETIEAGIDGREILGMKAEDDLDDVYFNVGATKLTALILSKETVNELDLAYLVVIVRG